MAIYNKTITANVVPHQRIEFEKYLPPLSNFVWMSCKLKICKQPRILFTFKIPLQYWQKLCALSRHVFKAKSSHERTEGGISPWLLWSKHEAFIKQVTTLSLQKSPFRRICAVSCGQSNSSVFLFFCWLSLTRAEKKPSIAEVATATLHKREKSCQECSFVFHGYLVTHWPSTSARTAAWPLNPTATQTFKALAHWQPVGPKAEENRRVRMANSSTFPCCYSVHLWQHGLTRVVAQVGGHGRDEAGLAQQLLQNCWQRRAVVGPAVCRGGISTVAAAGACWVDVTC